MNATSDFFGWAHSESEAIDPLPIEKLDLYPPSLVGSDSDFSSLDDSLNSSRCSSWSCSPSVLIKKTLAPQERRRVVFNTRVEVREYSVTIGDHPCCNDGLPISLDWDYSPDFKYWDINTSRERSRRFKMPRRLHYTEKKARLLEVSSYTNEEVRSAEINMVMNMLQHSWSQSTNLLPMPEIEEIVEEGIEEEEEEEEEKPDVPVIYWKRNRGVISRSKSFSE